MPIAEIASPYLPLIYPASAIAGVMLVWWCIRVPQIAIGLLTASLVFGQLIRLTLPGQGGGILPSDIAVVLVLISAIFSTMKRDEALIQTQSLRGPPRKRGDEAISARGMSCVHRDCFPRTLRKGCGVAMTSLLLTLPFLLWSIFPLIINTAQLDASSLMIALSYWLRLSVYLLLLPALISLCAHREILQFTRKAFIIAAVTLIALGFLQIIFIPNMVGFVKEGWDPHQGRMVSTWLDPNLFGIFLIMATAYAAKWKTQRTRITTYILPVTAIIALLITQSRSSIIALIASALILSPLIIMRTKRVRTTHIIRSISIAGILFLILILAWIQLGTRAPGLFTYDDTVVLRSESLKAVWEVLAVPHTLLGTGYNAYQFAAEEAGLINDFAMHARAGADNSWLTLWVTTGIFGIILFLLPWMYVLKRILKQWLIHGDTLSLIAIFGFTALFIHSQFINSFLYAHLLITIIIITALACINNKETI